MRNLFAHKQSARNGAAGYHSPYLLEILSTQNGAPSFQTATGALVANTGQTVSCSRAASAYCLGDDGLLHLLGANTVRVEPSGLLVEGAATNYCVRSNTFTDANWTKDNAAVAQNVTGPDGVANSAWTWTASAGTGTHRLFQNIPVSGGIAATTASVYIKAGTAPYVGLSNFDGNHNYAVVNMGTGAITASGGTNYASSSVQTLGNGWFRLNVTTNGTQATSYVLLCPGNVAADCISGGASWTAAGTETVLVWQADACTLPHATSPIVTAAAAVTRDADVVTVTSPLASLGTGAPGSWSASSTVVPLAAWSSYPANYPAVLACPANYPQANSWWLYRAAGTNYIFDSFDAANAQKFVQGTGPETASDPITFLLQDVAGTLTLKANGSTISGGAGGAGTGIIGTQNSTLRMGGGVGGLNVGTWHLRDIYVDGAITVPGAPTIGTATAGDASATLTWTAPVGTGGAAITSYEVTSSPATTTQVLASGGTFTGLTNGVAYTFTVKARNSVGLSAASAASNSVTPSAFTPPSNVYLDAGDVTDMANWLGRTNVSVALNANNYAGTPNSANTVTTTGAVVGHFATTNNTTGNATHLGLAAKAGTWTHLCVWSPANTGNYSVFDISGGTVDSDNGNAVGTVTSLGGGWYWIDTNFPSGVNANTFRVKPGSTNAITPASTEDGSGSDTVFLGPFAAT